MHCWEIPENRGQEDNKFKDRKKKKRNGFQTSELSTATLTIWRKQRRGFKVLRKNDFPPRPSHWQQGPNEASQHRLRDQQLWLTRQWRIQRLREGKGSWHKAGTNQASSRLEASQALLMPVGFWALRSISKQWWEILSISTTDRTVLPPEKIPVMRWGEWITF